jgi:hypothetical protein
MRWGSSTWVAMRLEYELEGALEKTGDILNSWSGASRAASL